MNNFRRLTTRVGIPLRKNFVRGSIISKFYQHSSSYYEHKAPSIKEMYKTVKEYPNQGIKYLGLAGALGLGAYIAYVASRPSSYVPRTTRDMMSMIGGESFASKVRSRIMSTFGYLSGSIVITGATAYILLSRGIGLTMAFTNPIMYSIGTFVGIFACISATQAINGNTNPIAKHVMWSLSSALIGFSLIPLSALAGPAIIKQASMITGCIVGSLSTAAMFSPNDYFLQLGPYLGVGFGIIIAASLGGIFFPQSSLLLNISLYGGLGLFGLLTAHDSQRILHDAEVLPYYDPISEQMSLYLDTINIFVRIVQILMLQQRRK
jgi:FtsH-binding integral membrane protein